FLDVFAHIIGADVHQLDAVQGAAALVRADGRVGRQAGEGELGGDQCLGGAVVDFVLRTGVPVQAGVQVTKLPVQRHVDLADTGFLRGRAVDAEGALQLVLVVRPLDGEGRADGAGP